MIRKYGVYDTRNPDKLQIIVDALSVQEAVVMALGIRNIKQDKNGNIIVRTVIDTVRGVKVCRWSYKEVETIKTPIENAAEFIFNSPIDYCKECCADFKRCDAEMKELYRAANDDNYIAPRPPKEHCIANIIKFFEQDATNRPTT